MRSSRCSWARRSRRARDSSWPRLARCRTLTSETHTREAGVPETRVVDVPGVPRFEVAPHHCFACGTLNKSGMGLILHVEPRRCWTELTLERRFEGWDGIAHGGKIGRATCRDGR